MRLRVGPQNRVGAVLAFFSLLLPYPVQGGLDIEVDVALRASFNSAPYLLELLLVPSTGAIDLLLTKAGKQLQKRIRLRTFLY